LGIKTTKCVGLAKRIFWLVERNAVKVQGQVQKTN
jgi:hypothetical protein